MAQTILDVMSAEVRPPLALNIVHPRPVSWQFVIASLHSALVAEMELDPGALNIAPFEEWLSLIQKRALDPTQDDLEKIVRRFVFFYASRLTYSLCSPLSNCSSFSAR